MRRIPCPWAHRLVGWGVVTADLDARLDQLRDRVAALEAELALLRATTGERLRTRCLVIEDDEGQARVVLDARHRTGSVLVRFAGNLGATTGIELYAAEAIDDAGQGELGWCVLREGDVVSRWTAG
jgi:hypothetical protein